MRQRAKKSDKRTTAKRKKAVARPARKIAKPRQSVAALLPRLKTARAERNQALAQQAATTEILAIINRSPGDLAPVFDAVLERAMRLCDAAFGGLLVPDGEFVRYVALRNVPRPHADFVAANQVRLTSFLGPAYRERVVFQVEDAANTEGYRRRIPIAVSSVEQGGVRTALFIPLAKDSTFIGALAIYRQEVRPFTERQIALAQGFAVQAAIAMENARLLDEINARNRDLTRSLERQTATSDILHAIAASPGEAENTLRKIAETTARLFSAVGASFRIAEGNEFKVSIGVGRGAEQINAQLYADPAKRPTVSSRNMPSTVVRENRQINIPDLHNLDPAVADWPGLAVARAAGIHVMVGTPLRTEGRAIGALMVYRDEPRPLDPGELQLLQSFADQAVIAIENARLLGELRARTEDLQESLEYQTATSDVLKVISRSTFDLQPVLDTLVGTAGRLCGSDSGGLAIRDGDVYRYVANYNQNTPFWEMLRQRAFSPGRDTMAGRVALEGKVVHIPDVTTEPDYALAETSTLGKIRTLLGVPLLREGQVVGTLSLSRQRVEPFTDRQVELVRTFADQAVIAIENARLLTELRDRTADLQQSLEYQTATSDVLKVISRSTFDLTPVLQYVLDTAMRLCHAVQGSIFRLDGTEYRWAVGQGLDPVYEEIERTTPIVLGEGTIVGRAALRRQTVQIVDAWDDPTYAAKDDARITIARTMLGVPLLREGVPVGVIAMARKVVEPFTDKEIDLVTTFADQAVIAIENARLLTELDKRQAELRVTFDNMGDAVIMFDGAQRLVAWNRNFQQMLDIEDDWLAVPRTYSEYANYLTGRGEFGDQPAPALGATDQGEVRATRYERTRPDGRVLEVQRNPVPGGGGFVFIYSDITERKIAERSILAAREAAEHALADLKAAQANLVQAEKMASLGQLTAGIAHEIKNPLNFVNNFAALSNELLGELKETAAPALATLDEDKRAEIDETMAMLTGNLEKIQEHGRRADGIVKSMLAHSRGGSGDRREADVNALVEESLNLAYHGARAQDQNFNITLERDYDKSVAPIELVPQDITRVFLNLCGNGFYAANKRRRDGGEAAFRPILKVSTREAGNAVEVRIRDNGIGIPPDVKAKLFQPFFTTKPTGEGTGLGLSISYDIVTQQHGGTIEVDSRVGDFTEFTIRLPRNRQTANRGTA